MRGTKYDRRAEAFLRDLMREHYQVGAGLKQELQVAPIYERYADLFTVETVRDLLERVDEKANRHLAEFATSSFISNQTKEFDEAITNAELQATVEWDGEQIPYQNVRQRLVAEADWRRRHELANRAAEVMARQNPLRQEALDRTHDLAVELGFQDYTSMVSGLKALDLTGLAATMRRLLTTTEGLYSRLLEEYLAPLQMPRDEVEASDISYLFRAREYDDLFPAERLLPALETTLNGLGIPLAGDRAPRLDIEARPLKSPRAFCAPVQVPDEVYLVIKPVGGQDDFQALMHEAGHAEHFSWVDPEMPFAYRYLGDDAVSETYAFLFEHLTYNRQWLEEVLDAPAERREAYHRFSLFSKLWFLRRYAAKLIYELEHLHAGDPDSAAAYVRLLNDALKVKIDPRRYLDDVDAAYYAAGYIRAWLFEMQLRTRLEERFGPRWWTDAEAGTMLKELWAIGIRDSVDEIARQIGYDGLSLDPLLDEFAVLDSGSAPG